MENALLVEVPEQLACPRFNCNTNYRASCSPGWRTGCGGRSLSLSFRMESTTDGSRIPRLAEFARIKTNSFGLITPKAGRSIRLSQSKVVWWTRPGSNRRPPHCERGALPAELLAHEQRNNFSKGPGACQHAFRRP